MTHPRPTLTTINLYYFQSLLKKPVTIVILATLSLFLILTHHYHSRDVDDKFSYEVDSDHNWEFDRNPRAIKFANKHDQPQYDKRLTVISGTSQEADLLLRIEDLKKIKASIRNELKSIEREKVKLLKDKSNLVTKNEKLVAQINRSKQQLKQLELDISETKKRNLEELCDMNRVSPIVFNPMQSVDIGQFIEASRLNRSFNAISYLTERNEYKYRYDLSLCPLTKEFKFSLLETAQLNRVVDVHRLKIDPLIVKNLLISHRQYTSNLSEACLVISLLDTISKIDLDLTKNNLVINLIDISDDNQILESKELEAVLASSMFDKSLFRIGLDLVLPSIWQSPVSHESVVGSIPAQSPIERKYLASYFGQGDDASHKFATPSTSSVPSSLPRHELNNLEEILQVIHRNSIDDLFLFFYNCGPETNLQCFEDKEKMMELSTFLVILFKSDIIDNDTNDQLYLALSRGAIPVIVGKERVILPFDEVIDWRRATILIPTSRLPEMHFILRSYSPADLYQLKYNGRRIFENYLATAKQILDTTIAVISLERFNYPPPPVPNLKTISYFNPNDLILDVNCTSATCIESKGDSLNNLISSEIYGPQERQFPSPSFRRNFSLSLNLGYELWNNPMYSPLQLFPSNPMDPIPPSEYKFTSTEQGYRPIGDGLGGSGPEFSRALGGDRITEQFTIVLLTYERELILMKTLERMKGLAYLNKILVVWNGINHKPSRDIIWPDIGAPIELVKVNRNSLNNRFLPYDSIETDAILSLDDDSPLRPDEIVFAFRVWRQSRDQIVGFPGRFHAWDSNQNTWMYNSNHSCELSMVLTGGAFFHKYYSYIYTYSMPEVIRSIVDKFMNCEDIAMNFLVAHLTRKPPIKVTSRWTFHCPNCVSSLSQDDSHFRERHECLNTFASIYGYMPLLNTQHRSDSVLFKTRLPHDKQKCFKFV